MYENAKNLAYQQQGSVSSSLQQCSSLQQQSPKTTLGNSVDELYNRIVSCHSYVSQIEDRISGPIPQAVPAQNAPPVSGIQDALDLAKGQISHLENRLAMLLDRM